MNNEPGAKRDNLAVVWFDLCEQARRTPSVWCKKVLNHGLHVGVLFDPEQHRFRASIARPRKITSAENHLGLIEKWKHETKVFIDHCQLRQWEAVMKLERNWVGTLFKEPRPQGSPAHGNDEHPLGGRLPFDHTSAPPMGR